MQCAIKYVVFQLAIADMWWQPELLLYLIYLISMYHVPYFNAVVCNKPQWLQPGRTWPLTTWFRSAKCNVVVATLKTGSCFHTKIQSHKTYFWSSQNSFFKILNSNIQSNDEWTSLSCTLLQLKSTGNMNDKLHTLLL